MLTVPDGFILRKTRKIEGIGYVLSVIPKSVLSKCPKCGHNKLWRSGVVNRVANDIPHNGLIVILEVSLNRKQCKRCWSQFSPPMPDELTYKSRLTTRFKRFLVEQVDSGKTFTEVGNQYGLSFDTVSRVYKSSTGNVRENWRSLKRIPRRTTPNLVAAEAGG